MTKKHAKVVDNISYIEIYESVKLHIYCRPRVTINLKPFVVGFSTCFRRNWRYQKKPFFPTVNGQHDSYHGSEPGIYKSTTRLFKGKEHQSGSQTNTVSHL